MRFRTTRQGHTVALAWLGFILLSTPVAPTGAQESRVRGGLYGWAAQNLVRSEAAAGQPAYLDYFRHGTPAERARDLVAFHASEVPYVFGQVGATAPLGPNWPRPPQTREEERLADAMIDYWASPVARRDLRPAAFDRADALVGAHRRQGVAWRLNMGFLSFPEPRGDVDASAAEPHR